MIAHRSTRFGLMHQSGFSLVETMIMAVIIAVAAASSITLYTMTIQQGKDSDTRQNAQEAVSEDVASVISFNNRVVCLGGTGCSINPSDPNESGYISSSYSPDAATNYFRDRCKDINSRSLATEATSLLTLSNIPEPNSFSNSDSSLKISRQVSVPTSNDRTAHRYLVTWTQGGRIIRQLSLTPQVASWCP